MAMAKYMIIGPVLALSVPAIATMIILKMHIERPLKAVPIVYLDTTDWER